MNWVLEWVQKKVHSSPNTDISNSGDHLETKPTVDDDLSTKTYGKIYPRDENDRTFVDLVDIITHSRNASERLHLAKEVIVENNGGEGNI